ncbi:MAG: acyloxyacyl hydrolase [Chitinophagales bacterium]|nr:acyloxyacyl hydrolase [Chitinophagales bacterium]MDW8393979.1 acyloxyacyl hydrolase [Chitinophagales bacterium]
MLLCILCASLLAADSVSTTDAVLSGWRFAAWTAYGRIVPHTIKFRPSVDDPYVATELNISRQTRGTKAWQSTYRYPAVGLALSASRLGNDSILGQAWGAFPFVELPLAGWKNRSLQPKGFSLTFRLGSGLAWLTRWYDPETNPDNNVIPARLNNITQFQVTAEYRISRQWAVGTGLALTHYSSGAVRVPNLGINIPSARLGLSWQPSPWQPRQFLEPELPALPRRFTGYLQAGLGFQESYPPDGPQYHLISLEAAAGCWLGRKNVLSAGIIGHFKESSWAFIHLNEFYSDKFFLHSLAAAPFLRDDIVIGNIGVALTAGYFVYAPSPQQIRFFQRIGWYYDVPLSNNPYINRLALGVYLTAGSFSADYVSVELGWHF